jgi:hypothetical protein
MNFKTSEFYPSKNINDKNMIAGKVKKLSLSLSFLVFCENERQSDGHDCEY